MRRILIVGLLIAPFSLVPGHLFAGQSVEIVSDIDAVSAGFEISSSDLSRTDLNIRIPAISLMPIELNSTQYQEVLLPVAEHMTNAEISEEGKPDIPALTTLVAIPDQAGVRLNVTNSGYDVFENIDLAPVQPAQPESDPTPVPFGIDNIAYSTDAFYPGELADVSKPAIMRDVRFVQVALYPVQYNPVRRELRVYRDLSVSLSYDGPVVNPKEVHHRYLSEGFYPIYKGMISNFDELFSTAQAKRGGYMIIAKPMFIDSLKALVEWKHRMGYAVELVSTHDIDPTDNNPSTIQVFNYIRSAYNTWEVPPEYVMIVGDLDNLTQTGIVDYPYSYYASDHEYACVEGTDYLPELFVGRMSVDNMTEFRKAIAKIFKYERNPQMFDPQHWIRGLSVGFTMFATARLTTLWVRQLQMQHGFVRVDTVYGSSDPNGRIRQYLNEGRAMTQYRGEGGVDGWWGPSFYISDLNALLNNQKLGVMAILTCGTGNFGGECLGEEWLVAGLNPDSLKGGPAYYGVSDGGTHTKWNNPIMVGYFWGIFGENNYHFASAAVRGKMQQYMTFPRYRGNGSYVEQYFHTYNMLGDPGLELRTAIPKYILVAHADTVSLGLNHYEVTVTDSNNIPVSGAYVTLIKKNDFVEELFSVEKTDEAGNAILYFDAPTTGTMALTVSGQNLIPFLGNVEIVTSEIAIGNDSTAIDDDSNGNSWGNADGLVSPNETIEITLALKNFGTGLSATDVEATLESLDEHLVVLDNSRSYGDIAPGQVVVGSQPFLVSMAPDAVDGDIYRLELNVTDQNQGNWRSLVEIPISAPGFAVAGVAVSDENNRLDQGDTAAIVVTLLNRGTVAAQGVDGYVTTEDDYSIILSGNCSFGDIPVDSSRAGTSISLATAARIFDGHSVNLMLHTTMASGIRSEVPFSVSVGAPSTSDPTGPDAYGYYMYDNTDTGYTPHPTYQWIDTAPRQGGQGTRLVFSPTDDKSILVSLPFDFRYYGKAYQHIIVSINGFIATDTARMDMGGNYWANFFNWPIPDPGNAGGQISPFWDDLRLNTPTSKGIFTWNDTVNHVFVIEYDSLANVNPPPGGAVEWFEVIITDPAYHPTLTRDSEILFQYRAVVNNQDAEENYSSVGFEDPSETIGLQYSYDNTYPPTAATLISGRAIKITTNTGGGGIKGTVNLYGGGQNGGVVVMTSTGQYRITDAVGDYWIKNIPPGNTSLTAQFDGFFPMTIDSLNVPADQTMDNIDFDMTACPVPTNFHASDSMEMVIELTWDAVTHGDLAGYNVYRSRWQNGQFVKLNTQPITSTNFIDLAVLDTNIYWYYVEAVYSGVGWTVNSMPSIKDSGNLLRITGASDGADRIPREFFLAQNYPNPFNPSTSISYGLPSDAHVKIEIFNLLGQRIKALVNEEQSAGYKRITWDGRDDLGKAISSGTYLYRLRAGEKELTMKMLLLK